MKNQKGFAPLVVLAVIAITGTFASGLVTVDTSGPHLHREVLKQGKPIYTVNQ